MEVNAYEVKSRLIPLIKKHTTTDKNAASIIECAKKSIIFEIPYELMLSHSIEKIDNVYINLPYSMMICHGEWQGSEITIQLMKNKDYLGFFLIVGLTPKLVLTIDKNGQIFDADEGLSRNTHHIESVRMFMSFFDYLFNRSTSTKMIEHISKPKGLCRIQGKSGLEVKVITIEIDQTITPRSEYKGGHHASPRLHTRRGHYKTRNGKKILGW